MNVDPEHSASIRGRSVEESSETDVSEIDTASDSDRTRRQPFKKADFDPKEWELVEEDNCLIELHGVMQRNFLSTCDKGRVKITGLFEPDGKSFLQLDDVVFVGEPSESFGTNVLFEKVEPDSVSSDDENTFKSKNVTNQNKKKTKLEYFTHTDKKLSMYRALLLDKDQQSAMDLNSSKST